MFSPEASIQDSTVLRNPRRRQRATPDESLAILPSTKRRKRSSIAPDTFNAPSTRQLNGHISGVNGTANGSITTTRKVSDAGLDITSLTINGQGSKKTEKERQNGDQVELARTDNFVITHNNKIPAPLQDIIDGGRSSSSGDSASTPWRADVFTDLGYAVAVTHNQAFIWRHGNSAEIVPSIISLPQSTRSANPSQDTLPLATLVHDSSSGELALLIVMPTGGKITYWDNVSNAANVDSSRQKNQGLHGAVSGLYSSELITKVISAEPDGFLLATSNGRLMHLSIKDAQGRPSISVHNLREESTSNVSLFGTIRGVLSGAGWNKSIVAIHALPMQGRSRRKCIIATNHGLFQIWSFQRQSSKSLEYEVDAKHAIINACRSLGEPVERHKFQLLDFALMVKAHGDSRTGQRMMAMVAFDDGHKNSYYFVDMVLGETAPDIDLTYEIAGLSTPSTAPGSSPTQARLLLPPPAHTAFIMLDSALVLVSLSQLAESPSSQLQLESDSVAATCFIELLPFNRNRDYHMVGCAPEENHEPGQKAACSMFLSNLGLCTIATTAVEAGETRTEQLARKAKSNLEQVVFYGGVTDNFIDFQDATRWKDLDHEEITVAALQVSDSIVDCTSKYIPRINPTLEHQLKVRAQALADLNKIVGKSMVSRGTRWYLLANAEKMAAARALWKLYNEDLQRPAQGGHPLVSNGQERRYLPLVVSNIHEDYWRKYPPADFKDFEEENMLRWYVVHEVSQLKWIIPYAQAVPVLNVDRSLWSSSRQQVAMVSQSTEIIITVLEAGLTYREENAQFYGLGQDMFDDGIYQGVYDMLESPWTSEFPDSIREHVNTCIEMADRYVDAEAEDVPFDEVRKLVVGLPRLIHLCCQMYEEHGRYLASKTDEKSKAASAEWQESYRLRRYEMIVRLDELEIPDEGIKLAERYEDMRALAQLITASTARYLRTLDNGMAEDDADMEDLQAKVTLNQQRTDRYYEKFGTKWVNALCDRLIAVGKASQILSQGSRHREYITTYLRKNPEAARLCWMNEVTVERDYRKATDSLLEANRTESSLWGRNVTASLAKLSQMAVRESGQGPVEQAEESIAKQDNALFAYKVQEKLEDFFRLLTRGAIDTQAELELLLDAFTGYVLDKPALHRRLALSLGRMVDRLVVNGCDLIDLITLIMHNPTVLDDSGFQRERFFLALKVNEAINKGSHKGNYQLYERLIWRRVMLQDDWQVLNQFEGQLEEVVHGYARETALWRTIKTGYQAGLFDKSPPPSPANLHPAGETVAELHKALHFATEPEPVAAEIAKDHATEDAALEEMLSKGKLEVWWKAIVEAVKLELREEKEAAEHERKKSAQEKQEREATAAGQSSSWWGDLEDEDFGKVKLLTNGVVGSMNGRMEGDEDVDMVI